MREADLPRGAAPWAEVHVLRATDNNEDFAILSTDEGSHPRHRLEQDHPVEVPDLLQGGSVLLSGRPARLRDQLSVLRQHGRRQADAALRAAGRQRLRQPDRHARPAGIRAGRGQRHRERRVPVLLDRRGGRGEPQGRREARAPAVRRRPLHEPERALQGLLLRRRLRPGARREVELRFRLTGAWVRASGRAGATRSRGGSTSSGRPASRCWWASRRRKSGFVDPWLDDEDDPSWTPSSTATTACA